MLRVSTRGRYGLRALIHIAAMQRFGKTATAAEISEGENISEKYLEHLLSFLRTHGIIAGKRGSKGGYKLHKKEDEITVLEVLEILDGPIEPVFCVSDEEACERAEICPTRPVWVKVYEAVRKELSSISLKDLVDNYLENMEEKEEKRAKPRRIC
jgi:Rrf2 family protein